jgi:hypothetical protein
MTLHRLVEFCTGPLAWRGLVVLAAALTAAALLAMPVRLPVRQPATASAPAAPSAAAAPPQPAASYPAIAAHPLFSPTREPYVAPPAPPPAAAAETSALHDYRLLGTVVEGNTRIALLKPPDNRKTIRAVPGQIIAGWTLREITPDTLEFANGAERFALHFPRPRWPHP